ncbi:M3 family metallopeptidase [Sphingomonas sp. SORGH_AS_0879]|uniref:M3 family metallopeptidase n=1 Tax=Sphingomonas sp. SORGH_AS_0879 TaxID=3041790 RepID=UPI002787C291|nr:M3 family metallopeptidase [Sphingomonas sp. SORGH_AS_0879]MDQ1231392.1 oligopeptidase A [Sphingomonas sp. SORGH_AS_0879]
MTMNPLLADTDLPDFAAIRPEHLVPAVDQMIADARAAADRIGGSNASDFADVVLASERAGFAIARGWSPASHLHSVADTPELRAAFAEAQAKLAEYGLEAGQDPRLFAAFNRVNLAPLTEAEARAVVLARRDFTLSGVGLDDAAKARFREIGVELNKLTTEFGNAVLDSSEAWSEHVTDEALLSGLTDNAKAILAAYAAEKELDGWLVTLREPSVQAILTQADNRDLRARVAKAYATRASDQAADPSHDNSARIDRILALRHEAARLLGFSDAAARSVETKMAQSADEALAFLSDLATRARPLAERELAEASAYAAEKFGIAKLEPWDTGYVAEHMRRERFGVDREAIRAYFPLPRVMEGTIALIERLYGIRLVERAGVSVWNADVRYYDVQDASGEIVAGVYCDFHARAGKRGGAWMDVCRPRFRDADRFHRPIAYLTCNFPPATGDTPALLAHGDVVTLLHEFGHVLHHLLTEVDLPSIGGISGVEWDAVELPSQFMENFAWDRATLTALSAHVETGEPLPDDLFAKMLAARRFQAGLFLLRQIEFATFDLRLHRDYDPATGGRVMEVLNAVRDEVAVIRPPEWNRFPHSFSHIFAGGYAAGYYSYLWAELLSADAFAAFAEEGQAAGDRFRREVLARGASRPAAENFRAFRGRAPQPDALLRHHGLAA